MKRATWVSILFNDSPLVHLHNEREEVRSAIVGGGKRIHLAHDNGNTVCNVERRGYSRLPVAFDRQERQADCKRCLKEIEIRKTLWWIREYKEE